MPSSTSLAAHAGTRMRAELCLLSPSKLLAENVGCFCPPKVCWVLDRGRTAEHPCILLS